MATEVNKILLELEFDAKGVITNLDQVQKKLKGVGVDIDKTGKQFSNFSKGAKQGADAAGIAGAAAAEFGRTISDLPFGIQAITNNVSQLGSMFSLLVVRTGSFKNAISSLLSVFKGPAGFLIIFQIAVAAVEFFSQAQRKAKRDTDATTQALDLQAAAVENLLGSFNISELVKGLDYITSEDGIGGAFTDLQKRLSDVVDFLIEKSPEFRAAFESLTPQEQKDVDVLRNLVKEYGNIIKIRELIASLNKELQDEDTTEKRRAEIESDILDAEISLMLRVQEFKTRMSNELNTAVDTFYDFGKDAVFEIDKGFEDALRQRSEEFSEKFRGILDLTPVTEPEPYFPYIDLKKLETEMEIEEEYDKQEKLKEIREQANREKLQAEIATINAIADAKFAEVDIVESVFRSIADIAEGSRLVQALALVGESAAGIAKIVIDTQAGNAALRLQQAALLAVNPALAAAIGLKIKANNIAAAAGIAANVGSTATALSKLKAPVAPPGTPGLGGATDLGGGPQAPQFNVIGATGQNQLAAAIAATQQQPVKAYVVSNDVTTAQSLDRNIVAEASL